MRLELAPRFCFCFLVDALSPRAGGWKSYFVKLVAPSSRARTEMVLPTSVVKVRPSFAIPTVTFW